MKIDRLVSIIMILVEKKRVVAKDLATMFEVSLRTIYRDIDTISAAGIPVWTTPGVGGGLEIMPEYKIDKMAFSSGDLSSILMGLTNLSTMVQGNELHNAIAKIKNFIPPDKAKDIELKANQILIDLTPWFGNNNINDYLKLIEKAMAESRLLGFTYLDNSGHKTDRIVEPYQLVLKGNHWYFQGYCRLREDFRLFKFAKILKLTILEEKFTPREYHKPNLTFPNQLAENDNKIKLRIHKSIMERLLDYCSYDSFVSDGNEHFIVSFPFVDNDYYFDVLLGFGDKCECLEPIKVRTKLKDKLKKLANMYK